MPETPELRNEVAGVLAVCDAETTTDGARYAIWHVGTAPEDTVPRLRGAWVVDSVAELDALVRTRTVWALSEDAADVVITRAGAMLDAEGTDAAVRAAVAGLDAAFTAEVERSGRKLKRPEWRITTELAGAGAVDGRGTAAGAGAVDGNDAVDGAGAAAGNDTDALVRRVLAAARQLEQLSREWSAVQSLRTSRPFLRTAELGGESAAPLPYAARS